MNQKKVFVCLIVLANVFMAGFAQVSVGESKDSGRGLLSSTSNNYAVQESWGYSGVWHNDGTWTIGGRTTQRVVSLTFSSSDNGNSLLGTMNYAGEGPILFKAVKQPYTVNVYRVYNQWGSSSLVQGGTWVLGNRPGQNIVKASITSSDGGNNFKGTINYAGEGPISFKANRV